MIEIPIGLLISGIITWAGNKALPAVFKHRNEVNQQRYEAAKYLCEQKNDCEALKAFSLNGKKSVEVKIIQPVKEPTVTPVTEIKKND